MVGMQSGVKRMPKQPNQKNGQLIHTKNKVRITTLWGLADNENPVTFVGDIKNWLDVLGIPHSLHTRVSRDHESSCNIHQTTIMFNYPSDLATFRIGYSFKGIVDIHYF